MRTAQILTTVCVVTGVILLILWPLTLRPPAADADRKILAEHGIRSLLYFGGVCFVWLGAAASAIWLARLKLEEFRRMESENLKALIEGSLRDHQKK